MIWMQDEIVHSTVAENKGRDWNQYEIELLWGPRLQRGSWGGS